MVIKLLPEPTAAVTPPAASPNIPEIPLITALPLARFDTMVNNADELLQQFLAIPHAHTTSMQRKLLAAFQKLVKAAWADTEEVMRTCPT